MQADATSHYYQSRRGMISVLCRMEEGEKWMCGVIVDTVATSPFYSPTYLQDEISKPMY